MACFKQLGHFELLRDKTLYHFSDNGSGPLRRQVKMTFQRSMQRAEPVLAEPTAGSSHGSPAESVNTVNTATVPYLSHGSTELHPVWRDALLEAGGPH